MLDCQDTEKRPRVFGRVFDQAHTVRKDPLNDPDALMFLKNVLKFGLKIQKSNHPTTLVNIY